MSSVVQQQETPRAASCWEEAVYGSDKNTAAVQEACPRGYYLDSIQNACAPLGPLGRISQLVETTGPLKRAYHAIANFGGVTTTRGVPFLLAYSIISNLNGALTLSAAWYMTCVRTGLSPLYQWKALLKSYGTLYALVQLLRPFRVAAAIAMSKLSLQFLEGTQEKLRCRRGVAIAVQYFLGYVVQLVLASIGIALASLASGVPLVQ